MAGAGDDPHLAPGRIASPNVGIAPRHHAVLLAPQQQGRRGDQAAGAARAWYCRAARNAGGGLRGAICSIGHSTELRRPASPSAPSRSAGAPSVGRVCRPASRPQVGSRVLLVEQAHGAIIAMRRTLRPERRHLGDERAADGAAGEIRALEARLDEQVAGGHQPVEMRVEHRMAESPPGKPGSEGTITVRASASCRGTESTGAGRRSPARKPILGPLPSPHAGHGH